MTEGFSGLLHVIHSVPAGCVSACILCVHHEDHGFEDLGGNNVNRAFRMRDRQICNPDCVLLFFFPGNQFDQF